MHDRDHTEQIGRRVAAQQCDQVRIEQHTGDHHSQIGMAVQLTGRRDRNHHGQEVEGRVAQRVHQDIGIAGIRHPAEQRRPEDDQQNLDQAACNDGKEQRRHAGGNKLDHRRNRIDLFLRHIPALCACLRDAQRGQFLIHITD